MMPVKVRTVLFGEAAVVADRLNELFYDLAIKFNRLAGWLLERRDAR